jgi:soluble lytic murein transglycosylase-like protein
MLRVAIVLAALLGICATASAEAELWGYIDAQGRPHYADRQIDNRYQLFNAGSAPVRRLPRSAATAPAGLLASFELSTGYKSVQHLIREAATDHGLDLALLKAVIATESRFDPRAVSPKGAVGLMQLMPATAERFGVKADADTTLQQRLTDPRTNLQAGARYLALLLRQFGGQTELALAAYNAGEGAVQRAGGRVPDYPETQQYVRKVTQLHQYLTPPRGLRPVGASLNLSATGAPAL